MEKVVQSINVLMSNNIAEKELDEKLDVNKALFLETVEDERSIATNSFLGYTVMIHGGSKQLNAKQESLIMDDAALLANEYERLRVFIR